MFLRKKARLRTNKNKSRFSAALLLLLTAMATIQIKNWLPGKRYGYHFLLLLKEEAHSPGVEN